jgi:hypothetical protein
LGIVITARDWIVELVATAISKGLCAQRVNTFGAALPSWRPWEGKGSARVAARLSAALLCHVERVIESSGGGGSRTIWAGLDLSASAKVNHDQLLQGAPLMTTQLVP